MPSKTLPLRVGPDGSWAEIITEGLVNLNKNYWFPDFTVQIGQQDETPVDNLVTVGLVNDLSKAGLDFTVTPLVSVPLGLLRTRGGFYPVYERLDESQASVIYTCFRHLRKMIDRHAGSVVQGDPITRFTLNQVVRMGATFTMKALEHMSKKKGFRLDKAQRQSLTDKPSKMMMT